MGIILGITDTREDGEGVMLKPDFYKSGLNMEEVGEWV